MLLPFWWFAVGVRCELGAGPANCGLSILNKSTNMVGEISEAMVLVAFPEPVGGGQREIAKARFALAENSLGSLQRTGLCHQCPEQEAETNNRAQRPQS